MKMRVRTFFENIGIAASLLAFGFVFPSCEIGLGAAVDVQQPTVTIESPTKSKVEAVHGDIVFSVDCQDDSGVAEIEISLSSNNTPLIEKMSIPLANPKKDGSKWEASLVYNKESENNYTFTVTGDGNDLHIPLSLKDGTYVFDVVGTDSSGRSSSSDSTVFDIDNTPPIFLLSSPDSLDISSPTRYGRKITLKGTIADDHPSTDKGSVKVYMYNLDAEGNKSTPIDLTVEDFDIADTANVSIVVAEYADTPVSDIQQNYAKAYTERVDADPDNNPDQKCYLAIEISDATTGTDGKPNTNKNTYIRSDREDYDGLVTLTRSVIGNDEITLEGSDLKEIWNGTYKGDLDGEKRSRIVEILEGSVANDCIGSVEKPYAINLNKNVNPTYSFSGYGLEALNGKPDHGREWGPSNNDSYLSFSVESGLDKANVKLNSLVVKIYESDISKTFGEIIAGEPCWSSEGTENVCESDEAHKALKNMDSTTEKGTYSVKLPGAPNVKMGNYYVIVVEGEDLNGNELVPADNRYYGFHTQSSGTPPNVNCENDKKWQKWVSGATYPLVLAITDSQGESSNFKATGSNAGEGLVARIKRFEGKKTVWESLDDTDPSVVSYNLKTNGAFTDGGVSGSNVYTETLNLPSFAADSGKNYTYEVEVLAKNGAGTSNIKQFILWIDTVNPEITFPSNSALSTGDSVTVTEADPYYDSKTGSYKLSWSATDTNGSGLVSCTAIFDKDGENEELSEVTQQAIETFNSSDFKVTDVVEKDGVKLSFTVLDGTGHSTTVEKTVKFDFSAPKFTDSYTDKSSYIEKNLGRTFVVTASDGLGISSLNVNLTRDDGEPVSGVSSGTENIATDKKTATRAVTFENNSADGVWAIKAELEDLAGRRTEKTFYVTFDSTAPVIANTFTVDSNTYQYNGTNYLSGRPTVTVKLDETVSGLSKVLYLVRRSGSGVPSTSEAGWVEKSVEQRGTAIEIPITAQFTPASGGAYDVLYVFAKDKAGNESTPKGFNISIDSVNPSLSYRYYTLGTLGASVLDANSTIYYKDGSVTLYGDVVDSGSGVDWLKIKKTDGTDVGTTVYYSKVALTKENAGSDSMKWTTSVSNPLDIKSWRADMTPTGTISLTAEAKDKSGLVSNLLGFCTLKNDTTAPEIVADSLSLKTGDTVNEAKMTHNATDGKYYLTVSGKWKDDLSGTSWLRYTYNDGKGNVSGYTSKDVSDASSGTVSPATSWSFSFPVNEGTGQKITLDYEDMAGNFGSYVIDNLKFDTSKPEITRCDYESVYNKEKLGTANLAEIEIEATDSLGIETVAISARKNGGGAITSTDSSNGITINDSLGDDRTHVYPSLSLKSPEADGKWSISVTVTDKAGRKDEKVFECIVDGVSPVISEGFMLNGAAWSSSAYYGKNNAAMTFSGSLNESVGMGKVYYKLVQAGASDAIPNSIKDDGTEISLGGKTGNNVSFSGTVSGFKADSETYNRLYVQAEDAVGNLTIPVKSFVVHMDDEAPSFSATHYKNGSLSPAPLSDTVLTGGTEDLTIYGTCADSLSGMQAFDFKVGGNQLENVSFKYSDVLVSETNLAAESSWSNAITENTKSWRAVIASSALNSLGGKTVYATVKDKAGNVTEAKAFSLSVDSIDPSLSGVVISGAYKKSGTEYYVGDTTVTLRGTSTDDKGIASTQIELKKGSSVIFNPPAQVAAQNAVSDTWSFSLDFTDEEKWGDNDEGSLKVTVYDKAGRNYEETYTIKVDKGKPVMLHNPYLADYKYQNNDVKKDRMLSVGGGKYSDSSFTNKTSLEISGFYEDAGSGIAKLYYQIWSNNGDKMTSDDPDLESTATGVFSELSPCTPTPKYRTNSDYSLWTDANNNPVEIPWPDDSTYYGFTMNLNGFKPIDVGSSGDILYLIAEDNCGNRSVIDEAKINVDQTASNVTPDSNDVVLTNGGESFTLNGTASDNLSGVMSIDFEIRGLNNKSYHIPMYSSEVAKDGSPNADVISYLSANEFSTYGSVIFKYEDELGVETVEEIDYERKADGSWKEPGTNGDLPNFYTVNGPCELKWELTITPDNAWFKTENLGTTPRVYANVTDYAGNLNSYPVGTLSIDKERPLASIESPSAEVAHNGEFSVVGSASDNNGLKSVRLYRYAGPTAPTTLSGWGAPVKGFTTETEHEAYEDSVSISELGTTTYGPFNFNDYVSSGASTGTVHFLLVAYDKAGNSSVDPTSISSCMTYSVDLDTDRPVVKFNEIIGDGSTALNTYTAKYTSRIYGTVTDDDGIKDIKISSTGYSSPEEWAEYSQPAGTLDFEPGSTDVAFNYAPETNGDGEIPLYIYIEDTAGGKFWTACDPELSQPKVIYANSDDVGDLDGVVKYRTDSNPPSMVIASGFGTSADDAKSAAVTNLRGGTTMSSSEVFGGSSSPYMAIAVGANDGNGIKLVKGSNSDFDAENELEDFTEKELTSYTDSTGVVYDIYTHVYDVQALNGQKILQISVEDNSSLVSKRQIPVAFDNAGPIVSIDTNDRSTLVGTVEIKGTSYDELSTVKKLWCTIFDNSYYNEDGTLRDDYETVLKNKIGSASGLSSSPLSWTASFDASDGLLKKLPTSSDGLAQYSRLSHPSDIYSMKAAVLAEDSLGNKSVTVQDIKYNPYGDRPMVEILSPAPAEGEYSSSASGVVRVSGKATDNELVEKVFVQISLGHQDRINESGVEAMKEESSVSTVWSSSDASGCGYAIVNAGNIGITHDFTADPDFWGIEANSTGSWYIILNKNNCLQKSQSADNPDDPEDDRVYTIWVRAAAVDNHGLLGPWSTPLAISINPKSPAIGNHNPVVKFYDEAGNFVGEKPYEDDMWIRGHARLVTTAEHANNISDIMVTEGEYNVTRPETNVNLVAGEVPQSVPNTVSEYNYFEAVARSGFDGGDVPGYEITVPIKSWTGSGTREIRISATEASESGLSKEQVYTFNYDNTKPVVDSLEVNGDDFFVATESMKKKLQNSNMQLSIGGSVSDSGSGFSSLLFAFYRGTGSNRRILDVMQKEQEISVGGLDYVVIGEESDAVTVYGKNASSLTWSNTTTFTIPGADSHIKSHGMVRLGDIWYLITGVSGNQVTIDGGIAEVSSAPSDAFFPYMQVVDNMSAEPIETWNENGHTFKSGRDDGDGMSETVNKSGSTWTWDATLHGNFLKDGPVTFVALVMDKAGNVQTVTREGSVENNPPRIAKVYLGTDLNGNDKFEDSEFELYDISGVTSMEQEAYDLKTEAFSTVSGSGTSTVISASNRAAFKAVDKLAVYPEIVGGNSDETHPIAMVYVKNADTENVHYKTETEDDEVYVYPLPQKKSSVNTLRTATDLGVVGNKIESAFILSNEELAGSGWETMTYTDEGKVMSFTFWDATSPEECEQGTNTQSCVLRVTDLRLSLTDSIPPRSVITPLYWNSGSDNSLYKNNKNNGHIELGDAWTASTNHSTLTGGLADDDPKVSGKITLTGFAYDETRIESLLVCFGNVALDGFASGGDCMPSTGKKTIGGNANNLVGAYCVNGSWTPASASIAVNGWEFEAENIYQDQRGHKAKWTLSLDTEWINKTNPAKLNVDICVYAMDKGGNVSPTEAEYINTSSLLDGETNNPKLRVDIVPYVMGLKTSLTSAGSNHFDRTALGHFPIRENETFYVYGFNLATYNATNKAVFKDKDGNSVNLGTSTDGFYSVNANKKLNSGKFSVSVGGIDSINNMNDNDACGSYSNDRVYSESKKHNRYSNFPNRFPNAATNNTLTDDMEIDVWQFNSSAATPSGAGKTDNPIMKINPNNSMVGFAFLSGSYWFAMPQNNDNSFRNNGHKTRDFMLNGGFSYDSAGNAYGMASGMGSDPGKADPVWFFAGHKEPGNNVGNYVNRFAIEKTGQVGVRLDGYKRVKNNVTLADETGDSIKDKVKSPSIATYRSGNVTNVYLAYYDSYNDEIRFRRGTASGSDESTVPNNGNEAYSYGGDLFTLGYAVGNNGAIKGFGANNGYYECKAVQVLATTFSTATDNDESEMKALYKAQNGEKGPLGPAGEYVSIDTIPASASAAGTVVLVWYDATHNATLYTYNETPMDTTWHKSGNDRTLEGLNSKNWAPAQVIFSGAGEFCQVKVDGNGGIHFAAYAKKGELRYAKLPAYNTEYDEATMSCVVDSKGAVGQQLTLDVVLEGTGDAKHAVPYIGYVQGSHPKLAKFVSADSSGSFAGAVESFFTGNWEVSCIPTPSKIYEVTLESANNSHINVALWKDASGNRKDSKVNGSIGTSSGNTVYGNGTDYPILGYQVWKTAPNTNIETAQMR